MSTETINSNLEILLVDDNYGDVRLVREILSDGKIHHNLSVVEDGEEAMAFLRKEGKYYSASRPDVILLDLNLPRKDGRVVLAEIKSDKNLMSIPIVVLTSSKAEQDIVRTYGLHANAYVTKSLSLDQFVESVKAIAAFWFTIVKLPPKERAQG